MSVTAVLRTLGARVSGALQVMTGQALYSLANFLTILAVGAWSGQEELGAYALGLSCYVLAYSMGDTLVATPYTYFRARPLRDARDLEAVAAWGTFIVASLVGVGLTLAWWGDVSGLARLWPVLPIAIVFGLMREYTRRQLVAQGRLTRLFRIDLAASLTHMAGIVALGLAGLLSARSAYVVMTLAAWVIFIPMRSAAQWRRIASAGTDLRAVLGDYIEYGRWLFLGGVCHVGSVQIYPWLAMLGGGERQAGLYAACAALVNLLGPLFLGLTNYFRPLFMAAFHQRGATGFLSYVVKRGLLFVAPAVVVALAVVAEGGNVLSLLYGESYRTAAPALMWMSLGMCAVAASAALQLALLAMRAPATNLYYHGTALLLLVVVAWLLREQLSLMTLGRMYGAINVAAFVVLGWLCFSVWRAQPDARRILSRSA
ncbi:MAG: hypothetical protein HYS20_12265 [Rhodocyclales bacterium]|nr:hypothetical protein [Rhodocyclales bacterium]